MAQDDLFKFIFKRRSIRRYISEPMDEKSLSDLRSFLATIKPLDTSIRTGTKLLDGKAVKGLARTDAPHFLAFYSEPKEDHLVNAGFMLQQLDLYLSANGIGSCYQGMAKVGKGVEAPAGLEFIIMISFGRPAEGLHRNSVAEFKREPIEKISTVKGNEGIIEAARLAPSGMNNQSWYFTGDDGRIDAFSERSLITDKMNRINVGIALCHMWLAAVREDKNVTFDKDQKGVDVPKGHAYIASMLLK